MSSRPRALLNAARLAFRAKAELWKFVDVPRLRRRLRSCTAPVVGSAPAIVSMTSHGQRLASTAIAIESIARGSVRPRRMILWLGEEMRGVREPSLDRLADRGLEIRYAEDLGPHTKYFWAAPLALELRLPLVTADDDIVYPRNWLLRLLRHAQSRPGDVVCFRAHRFGLETGGGVTPYSTWDRCWTRAASSRNFATGVSGVAYPEAVLTAIAASGRAFLDRAPKADDVWLHYLTVRSGTLVSQVRAFAEHFPVVPGTQNVGLLHDNMLNRRNDEQIAATYDDATLAMLRTIG